MIRSMLGIVALSAVAGCGGPAPTAPSNISVDAAGPAPTPAVPEPAATVLTAAGFGTIVVGKPPAAATGFDLRDDGSYDDSCRIFVTDTYPQLYALVEDGVVRRVTVHGETRRGAAPATAKGIHLGSTEAEVRAAYAPLGNEPHKYVDAPAKYLNYGEEGDPNGLRFEIGADGRVSAIHAGASPQLMYVEGCS